MVFNHAIAIFIAVVLYILIILCACSEYYYLLHEFSYIRLDGRIGCYLAVVRHCPKSSEKGEFLEQRNSMTQIMTQNSKSPLGQLGHVSKEFIKFSNRKWLMDAKRLEYLLFMISGPRGLGFESRHSDQKNSRFHSVKVVKTAIFVV